MRERMCSTTIFLWLIVIGYLAVATSYAVLTPAWQVPDEPAHYNYARFLAEQRQFPVLKSGDYPHQYLEDIKARHFPPNMSVDPIRYEFHQPPLYYLLSAGIYTLVAGASQPAQITVMRLLSVVIGAFLLLVAYRIVRSIFPRRPALALGTAAFIAFLPMHTAIMAGINNDSLAELMLGLILLSLVRYLAWRTGTTGPTPTRRLLPLGILLGLGLLTKTTVLYILPAVVLSLLWGEWEYGPRRQRIARMGRALLLVFGLALLMAAPWFIRNALTYGGLDILGLARHDEIVVGQLRTADWVAEVGAAGAVAGFLRTTFHSFWGQFGWMGVPLDGRLYMLLMLFCGLMIVGLATAAWRFWQERVRLTTFQWAALSLLGLTGAATIAGYLWYNTQFVQHQGRYLFPALIPIGLLATVGLHELFTRRGAGIAALVTALGFAALLALGLWRGDLPVMWLAVFAILVAGLGLWNKFGPDGWAWRLVSLTYAGLMALDLFCLFAFVVPYLS